jgi:hypothetical protein
VVALVLLVGSAGCVSPRNSLDRVQPTDPIEVEVPAAFDDASADRLRLRKLLSENCTRSSVDRAKLWCVSHLQTAIRDELTPGDDDAVSATFLARDSTLFFEELNEVESAGRCVRVNSWPECVIYARDVMAASDLREALRKLATGDTEVSRSESSSKTIVLDRALPE